MATLTVRNLDDVAYARLKSSARSNNRSLEAEARTMLERHVADIDPTVARLRAFQLEMRAKYGVLPDSTPGIRAERDEA